MDKPETLNLVILTSKCARLVIAVNNACSPAAFFSFTEHPGHRTTLNCYTINIIEHPGHRTTLNSSTINIMYNFKLQIRQQCIQICVKIMSMTCTSNITFAYKQLLKTVKTNLTIPLHRQEKRPDFA